MGHGLRLRHRRARAHGHPGHGDGLALEDHWAEGPRTFLGIQTAGFPNLFFPGGPHAAAGNNPRYNGDQVDFVTDALVYARDHGYDTIEVDPAAEERWTDMIDRNAASLRLSGKAATTSGPTSREARRYLLNSGGRPKLFKEIARVVDDDYKAFSVSIRRSDHGLTRARRPVRRSPPA